MLAVLFDNLAHFLGDVIQSLVPGDFLKFPFAALADTL